MVNLTWLSTLTDEELFESIEYAADMDDDDFKIVISEAMIRIIGWAYDDLV